MKFKTKSLLMILMVIVLAFSLSACGGAEESAPAEEEAAPAEEEMAEEEMAEEEEPMEVQDVVTWFQYDQDNEDPASDERVGNEYLRNTIPLFNEDFAGKLNWVNQPKAFDKMTTELVAAVQAAGEVPDLFEMSNTQDMIDFYRNGTAMDISEWATAQEWWSDLDASGIEACTGPDGGVYCVPVSQRPSVVYVWADRWPDGYPADVDGFMAEAERLKGEGLYAITFFGSTDKDGEGLTRAIWTTIDSFGGSLDDGQGNMDLVKPENIAAIEFLREIIAEGYVPEIAFAGGFQEEEAFKDASAASFPTGLFGYRYVNPLVAPDGTEYSKGNQEDMLDAIEEGHVVLRPFISAEGAMPGCGVDIAGFVIPNGAENVEGAYEFINWFMTDLDLNAEYVIGPGGGFPVLGAAKENALFATSFYDQAKEAVGNSACTPWYGSLQRPNEAQALVMTAIYKLIKEDPTADIAEVLTQANEEYNAGN